MENLAEVRKEIDTVDREMAALFERRMNAVRQVAEFKREHGLQVSDPQREQQMAKRNAAYIQNEAYRADYLQFLNQTMAVSRAYQHRLLEGMQVAFSGVSGAFAELAAKRIFPSAALQPYADFQAAYDAVLNGSCDCAVLPVENNFNGDVGSVLDLAFFGPLYVSGVYELAINQNLLANPGATPQTVRRVLSHPQALGQCAAYLQQHGYEPVEAVNTAVAARQVAESGRQDVAAIASDEAAAEYGLVKLDAHIQQGEQNTTRFAVFSRAERPAAETDSRFILLFTVKNEAGMLGTALSVIGANGFNLRALKSRPARDAVWSYYFYAEGEGRIASSEGRRMLDELRLCCNQVRVLSSYRDEIRL